MDHASPSPAPDMIRAADALRLVADRMGAVHRIVDDFEAQAGRLADAAGQGGAASVRAEIASLAAGMAARVRAALVIPDDDVQAARARAHHGPAA